MTRFKSLHRLCWFALVTALLIGTVARPVQAAPFAAYVMDARTGQPIYRQNSDTRLHPASLTKMMTLYLAFSAVESGQVRLDSRFTVSSNAAAEPPSKLGLRAGQQIELRYLLRAAAIKSANDAATTIGEGIAGSEQAFAAQMTQMARALGMNNTQFRNAHGLTTEGHFSTAHDMSILGRHLFYDFPQYYNLFSRRSADAGVTQVSSTNRRFLDDYAGADGIKTGYTRAAGFNLTASAQRGNKRLIATVFGGTSTAQRNQTMAELLDNSFGRVPDRVRETRPAKPRMLVQATTRRAQVEPKPEATRPEPQRIVLDSSPAPAARPTAAASLVAAAAEPTVSLDEALARATAGATQAATSTLTLVASARPRSRPGGRSDAVQTAIAQAVASDGGSASLASPVIEASTRPEPSPEREAEVATAAPAGTVTNGDLTLERSAAPRRRSETVILAAMGEGDLSDAAALEIVSRPPDSGRSFGIALGLFRTRNEARDVLVQLALQDGKLFNGADRHVADTARGWEPRFTRLSKADAELACGRLASRSQDCSVIGN